MKIRNLFIAVLLMVMVGPLAAQPVEGPNGNYYEYVAGTITWNDARIAAEAMSFGGSMGYLATVTSAEENGFVGALGSPTNAYFGANDIATEGVWEWVTGETWSYTAWGGAEPNNSGNEDCGHYRSDGLWNDIPCGNAYSFGYVVEYDAAAFVPQTNTFATSIMAAGGGDPGTPDMTISCNGGLPLTQTAAAGSTFTVTDLNVGDVCTIELASDLESGWLADSYLSGPAGSEVPDASGVCTFTIGAATAWGCIVEAAPAPVDFSVTVMWEISQDADPDVGVGAMVELMCSGGNYTSTTMPAGPLPTGLPVVVTLTGVIPGSTCDAYLTNVGSTVEANDCSDTIMIGDGDASCDITATAFFEGIPTLSQYGMAIMALLMLGIGFIGFRRFI